VPTPAPARSRRPQIITGPAPWTVSPSRTNADRQLLFCAMFIQNHHDRHLCRQLKTATSHDDLSFLAGEACYRRLTTGVAPRRRRSLWRGLRDAAGGRLRGAQQAQQPAPQTSKLGGFTYSTRFSGRSATRQSDGLCRPTRRTGRNRSRRGVLIDRQLAACTA